MAVGASTRRRSSGARRGGSRGTRRKLVWARYRTIDLALPAAGAAFELPLANFETEYSADLIGATIMRVRGELVVNTSLHAVVGLRIVTESTVAGLTSSSSPIGDRHADWMMYLPVLRPSVGDAEVRQFDVRAMRKLDELGQTLLLAWGNAEAAGTASAELSILVALP